MHPEMSLVFLTVLSGVGQGIFTVLVILDTLYMGTGRITPSFIYLAGAISLLFPLMGMTASFFHLGNPQRGWKAILMWKNSWLSREVIFLPAFLALNFAYLLSFYLGLPDIIRIFAGFLGILASLGLYISSAMLYAAIRYVKEWSNAFTPVNFVLFGITSGLAVLLAVHRYTNHDIAIGDGLANLLSLLASFSLILKALTYQHDVNIYPELNMKNALGINDPNIKMMDMGTAYDHYNTKEYFFPITVRQNVAQQMAVLVAAFFLPMLMAIVVSMVPSLPFAPVLLTIGAISMVGGLIIERRLFFIQGNHLQNLYYGNYRMNMVQNPVASKARKGTPVPKQ